jgi:ABC-type branched-subunit amino acid transport system substrate-binding protein
MRWRKLSAATALLAVGVVVAACGGDDSGGSKASSSTATKSTIKFGLINPTGSFTSFPDVNGATKAAVRALNARGGLAGHKVELVVCNDKTDDALAAKCARQMVSEGVVAMVGQIGLEDQVTQPILEAAGIPEVLMRATAESTLNSKNVYLVVGGTSLSYAVVGGYFKHKLNLPYNFMISDTPGSLGLQKSLLARFKAAGASPVSQQRVNPQQADFAPVVAAAGKGGAQAVMGILPYQQVELFSRAAASAGSPFKTISVQTLFTPKDADAWGGVDALDKVISVVPLPPLNGPEPGIAVFKKDLAAEEATGDGDAALDKQQVGQGFWAWLTVQALEAAVKQAKTTDVSKAGLKKAMDSAKDLDMMGLIKPWTPSKPGPPGLGRLSNDAYYVVGYKQGEPYLITPEPVSVSDALAGTF